METAALGLFSKQPIQVVRLGEMDLEGRRRARAADRAIRGRTQIFVVDLDDVDRDRRFERQTGRQEYGREKIDVRRCSRNRLRYQSG